MEAHQVGARGDHGHALGLVVVIEGVLLLDLVVRAGDHQLGHRQGLLLGIDAPGHVIAGLYGLSAHTFGQQTAALDPPEGVTCMHQRRAQHVRQTLSHIARVRVMAMDDIGRAPAAVQVGQRVVGEAVQVIPKLLLADIAAGAGVEAHDPRLWGQGLQGPGIILADVRIDHASGEQVDPTDVVTLRQGTGQLHHVLGLAAGIRVAAELQVLAADQAVDADQQDVQGIFCHGRSILLDVSPGPTPVWIRLSPGA